MPEDKSRFWYLILIVFLIFYNICGGLFPDPKIGISITIQNILAYGSGFLMASYFPYFFYRGFNLSKLRFHAFYGVPLFLLLPYIAFFIVFYAITRNLEKAIHYGMIIPFFYSIVIAWAMLNAIKARFKEQETDGHSVSKLEAMAVYCAVLPWVFMSVFAYYHVEQWIEVLCANIGFVLITGIFITRSIRRTKMRLAKFKAQPSSPSLEFFEQNLLAYNFTFREIEIIRLIRQGLSYQEIADKLFIAPTTVSRHIQNIHSKADVKSRLNLMRKLDTP
ncbi:MAG: helix-turn-helix transcriptional regulator [Pedobacter sp.]|jgi:DNA-binding CsgD family transcriptional regulator|uniref:helix-turn-helix transcriptional regulator n=1 Tax=Pedobacter sp. TaxID=1411316 RepID=UPI0035658BCA